MDTTKKNKPGPVVIISIAVIAIMIISYLILLVFFPDFFQSLDMGEVQPLK